MVVSTAKKQLVLPYQPRWYQLAFEEAMFSGKKRAVLNWHRRTGKDVTAFNYMVHQAIFDKPAVYNYIFPDYSQAKRALWDNIQEDGTAYLDYIPQEIIKKTHGSEMKITLVNGSIIQLLGGDSNPDSFRSGNPYGVVFSEYAYMSPLVWERVIDPVLTKNGGWAVFISTPQGKNHFKDLYDYAVSNPNEWYTSTLTIKDTGLISEEEIARKLGAGMSEDYLQQEYYCSFGAGVEGSYYGKLISQAEREGRIGHVPYDKDLLVYTAWDLGFSDYMSIIFFQRRGNEILIIDHYENSGYALSHYLTHLTSKEYRYGGHFAPHDGKNHNNVGETFQGKAMQAGFEFTVLPRQPSINAGIERVRGVMPRMFFDKKKCDYVIRCLQQYHCEYDDKARVFRDRPAHDWSSHTADAMRYLVQSLEYMTSGREMTAEDIAKLRLSANLSPQERLSYYRSLETRQ